MTGATAAQLAALVGGELEGSGGVVVNRVASADEGGADSIVLARTPGFFARAVASGAGCILTSPDVCEPVVGRAVIKVPDPDGAFLKVLEFFQEPDSVPAAGVSERATIEHGVVIGEGAAVGPGCWIGSGARIGAGSVIYPNVFIGAGVTVGEQAIIYPNVVIYRRCEIGSRVIIHAGCVIGADGFGYAPGECGLRKFPHIGIVRIEDDVEIGANSTVDRAKFGATVIGRGTKIDNLVHIAHNVRIGRNCVIVALSGIAGSVEIGDGVTLAAQTGVKDNVRIGDGCVVAARGGVIGDLAERSTVSGFPARDHRTEVRMQAMQLRLPEMLQRIRELEKEVRMLRGQGRGPTNDNTDD